MTDDNDIWAGLPRTIRSGVLSGYRIGQGPALVLIHGVGLRLEAWGAMLPNLSRHFTVYAMDMPGHGESTWSGEATIGEFANAFASLFEKLGGPVCVAGHSMGAMLAVELARRHPKIGAVAALNGIYQRSSPAKDAVLARAQALAAHGKSDPTPTLHRWFDPNPTGLKARASAACLHWLTEADPAGYSAAYMAFALHDGPTAASLESLACPALFATGADEPNSTPQMSIAMANASASGQALIIPDAAHMMPMTHGVEIADHLASFFLGRIGDS